MVLNTGVLGLDGVTEVIVGEAKRRGWVDNKNVSGETKA
jgi:hypothetical protein